MWRPDKLTLLDERLQEKWRSLESGLSIEIATPFKISDSGELYLFAVLIKNFGVEEMQKGLLLRAHPEIFTPDQCGRIWQVATAHGYIPMNITEFGIDDLTSETAKVTLLEYYRWYGVPEKKPHWHTGALYGHDSAA